MFDQPCFLGDLGDEPVRVPRPSTEHLPLEAQLAEERFYSWRLASVLQQVASLAQGNGYTGGVVELALSLVREHPVIAAQNQAVADFIEGHPELRYASNTAGITRVVEARLQRSGYVFPEGMHLDDV